jgi:hypothetical protein
VGVVARVGDQQLGGDGSDISSRALELCPHNTSPVDAVLERHHLVLSLGKTTAVNQILILFWFCVKEISSEDILDQL